MQDYYTPKSKHLTLANRRDIERWLKDGSIVKLAKSPKEFFNNG